MRGAALYPGCSCIWDTNWKWQLPPPKKGQDLTSLHFHTHSQCAGAVPSPSSPSTSPDAMLGEDSEGDSAVPYRGLFLLCVGIALIICAERRVSAGTTRAQLSHHQQHHQGFFQALAPPDNPLPTKARSQELQTHRKKSPVQQQSSPCESSGGL